MRKSLILNLYSTIFIRTFITTTAQRMRAVQLKAFGGPEQLYVDSNVPVPELSSADHVLIRVVATALNRADTLQRKGSYAAPKGESDILGLEASGIIDTVGSNVKDFRVGDKVMALLGGGGNAEYVSVHKYQLMRVPEGMDLVTAAGIPEAWLTSYQLLHFVGKIKPGETVLIHAAGSGVGTAAIQLAKGVENTTVIATAGTAEKLARAKELGADVLVNYKEADFSEVVQKETNGRGVDVILDPVGASNWEKNANSLALDSRWVLYGLLGGARIDGSLLGRLLGKRAQLVGTTLRTRSLEYKKELVHAFQSSSLHKFTSKQYHPIIDSVTTLEKVAEAHQRMESNVSSGKIIMKVSEEAEQKKSEL
ncbi:quinone oxidoreductase PIG3-like [Hydractinia symbiolongicarpus]|uniref:quinone oxidoreductase PIG3-like n=1 Tax=Hydractinia symbiolongicarpus TaxID=13093 RepID=UPI0025519C0B|nr:quinone oxidoreductase PIG3-like [Hydractinia symbiolongicarpus]